MLNSRDVETEGVECAEEIKKAFDAKWDPSWHVVIGKNFGSYVTHETRRFIYFYVNHYAIMIYKAG